MTCCLVRDLLPLYIEGDCETETERFISRHFESCGKCESLYHMMKEPLEIGRAHV